MTLRTDVFLSTPAVPTCLSASFAPLISRSRVLSLTLGPRYSVSCSVFEYSWRFLLKSLLNENNDGSLLSLGLSVLRSAEKGRRNRRVARYVVTRIANTATTMSAICGRVRDVGLAVVCGVPSANGVQTYYHEALVLFVQPALEGTCPRF